MKRCPQCEFIYEDDQSHCDMDGTRLSHDSQPLPRLQALTAATELDKPKWRNRTVTLSASLVLACVLALVSLVSIRQGERDTILPIPISIETPDTSPPNSTSVLSDNATNADHSNADQPANGSEPASTIEEQRASEDESTDSDPGESVAKPSSNRQNTTRPSKPSAPPRAGSTKQDHKDDSKVRSAIKKTGRFFKKALPL